MPLPWTIKNRVTRISQIVADFQSPKRGASLVVQTGFPTSLIDLFVKNRNHFRRPKSNKPLHRETSDPPPPETPSSSGCMVVSAEAPSLTQSVTGNLHGIDGAAGSGPEVSRVGKCGGGSGSKTVLATFLKMLAVVVLIASVDDKLTVGITVSAFALLFLEYAAKRVVLCSKANVEILKILTRGICSCVLFQKLQSRIKKDSEVPEPTTVVDDNLVLSDLFVGAECRTGSLSFEEIEVGGVCSEETSFDGLKLDCVNGDKKRGCSEFEIEENSNGEVLDSCQVSLCETKDSRSVKFKSKMKKLLPKKLRGSRKEGKERRGKEKAAETSIEGLSVAKDKSLSFDIEGEQKEEVDIGSRSLSFDIEGEQKEEVDIGSRSSLLLKIKQENEVDGAVNFSQECSLGREEEVVIVNGEEERIDRVGSSGWIILSVIALVGLVVGRFPALILTMAWYFMLKMVTKPGKSKAPLIRCSVPKS